MNQNIKVILTIGVLLTAGYLIYRWNQKGIQNPDADRNVGSDDTSPIIYEKQGREVQIVQ